MFWKKKWITRSAFGFQVDVTVGSDSDWIMRIFEKISNLQDQNRRDYNLLFERQNLILNHLNLEYVPESEKREAAKLVEKTSAFELPQCYYDILAQEAAISYVKGKGKSVSEPKKKKRGRPKGKK